MVAEAPPIVTVVSPTVVKPQPSIFTRSAPLSEPVPGRTSSNVMLPTVTTNEQLADWLPASVAVQFTVVCPIGNTLPDGGVHATAGDGSHRSVAVTSNVTVAPLGPSQTAERSPVH